MNQPNIINDTESLSNISKPKSKRITTLIFFIVYMAYMSIYVARVNLSIAGPELKNLMILDETQIGFLGSCFFVVYAVGRILNGTISDSAPPWIMLTIGLLITGVSNIFVGFLPSFAVMAIFWITNAYAQSMLWSSVLCVVSALYDKKTVKKKSSLMVTSVATGNILSILINTYVITNFGVKFAFVIPGIITIVLSILTFFATKNIKNVSKTAEKKTPFKKLLKNKELLTMDIVAMIHGVMKENISLWMAVYIADIYRVDLTKSSLYILLIPIIGFAGRIIYPLLYKTCKENEKAVSFVGFVFCIAASLILCFNKVGMLISVLALGGIYMAVSVINTSLLSIYPLSYSKTGNTAAVGGIMDFSTYLGAGISSAIYGGVIKYMGYTPMFISWIAISVAATAILIKLNKSKNKNKKTNS